MITDTTFQKAKTSPLCSNGYGASIQTIDELSTPKLRNRIGNNKIQVSTNHQQVAIWFNQGLNLLHGFWYIEAYRAFKQAIALDNAFAMGYWGLAMCQPGFAGEETELWQKSIQKANALKQETSLKEQRLIEASLVLISKGLEKAYPAFRQLAIDFSDNPELVALAAIIMHQAPNADASIQKEIQEMLERSLQKTPDNMALLHYYIHITETGSEFLKAKPAAEKLLALYAESPHLVHMAGHIYFLEGAYQKVVAIFEKAKTLEEDYHRTEKIAFAANQNYMHNLHYLAVAYTELGDYENALKIAHKYADIELLQALKGTLSTNLMIRYEGRTLPVFVHIRFRQWDKAIKILNQSLHQFYLPPDNFFVKTYLQALVDYCKGMKQIEQNQVNAALQHAKNMSQFLEAFNAKRIKLPMGSETALLNETYDILKMHQLELYGWLDNINASNSFNATAFIEAIQLEESIGYDEPPRLLYLIGERIGHLYLKRGEKERANHAFSMALKKRPNSLRIKSLTPTGTSIGLTYNVSVSGGVTSISPTSGTYGSATTFTLNNNSAGGGDVIITITDVDDASCTRDVVVTDPGACVNCLSQQCGTVIITINN